MKLFRALLVLVLIGGGAWIFATPYLTLRSIQSAVEARDTHALAAHFDFPVLKENLKSSLRVKFTEELARTHNDNPYGNALGAAGTQLALKALDPLLDAAITPESVALLLRGQAGASGKAANPLAFLSAKPVQVASGYRSFDTFAITLKEEDSGRELVSFLLKRHGIATWKVSGVAFPD
ncbi:MAG: DUF2939 domain-containing protein [Zoogloeaceae bacterium]|nr:DUF2939 domain-containing protein [Zoogloeaceae bacterium]